MLQAKPILRKHMQVPIRQSDGSLEGYATILETFPDLPRHDGKPLMMCKVRFVTQPGSEVVMRWVED